MGYRQKDAVEGLHILHALCDTGGFAETMLPWLHVYTGMRTCVRAKSARSFGTMYPIEGAEQVRGASPVLGCCLLRWRQGRMGHSGQGRRSCFASQLGGGPTQASTRHTESRDRDSSSCAASTVLAT